MAPSAGATTPTGSPDLRTTEAEGASASSASTSSGTKRCPIPPAAAFDQAVRPMNIALVEAGEAVEPGLEGVVVERDVLLPGDVALSSRRLSIAYMPKSHIP